MNLNIREIDPEARGLLYRLQAEQKLPNLADTIKFLVKNYYTKGSESTEPRWSCPPKSHGTPLWKARHDATITTPNNKYIFFLILIKIISDG